MRKQLPRAVASIATCLVDYPALKALGMAPLSPRSHQGAWGTFDQLAINSVDVGCPFSPPTNNYVEGDAVAIPNLAYGRKCSPMSKMSDEFTAAFDIELLYGAINLLCNTNCVIGSLAAGAQSLIFQSRAAVLILLP